MLRIKISSHIVLELRLSLRNYFFEVHLENYNIYIYICMYFYCEEKLRQYNSKNQIENCYEHTTTVYTIFFI